MCIAHTVSIFSFSEAFRRQDSQQGFAGEITDERVDPMRASRSAALVAACIGAVVVCTAGLAWACTASANLSLNPSRVSQGRSVEVSGTDFFTDRSVSIHFQNQGGQDVLPPAASPGPNPTTSFAVPADLAPGAYYIFATVVSEAGTTWSKTAALQVTAAAQSTGTNGGDVAPGGTTSGSISGRPAGSPASPESAQLGQVPATPTQAAPPAPAAVGEVQSQPSTAAPAIAATTAVAPSAARDAGAAPARRGAPAAAAVPGYSAAPETPAAASAVEASPPRAGAATPPSPRTAGAELWSGFTASTSADAPSLDGRPPRTSRSPSAGVAVLAVGLPLLLGVLSVAVSRRRAAADVGTAGN